VKSLVHDEQSQRRLLRGLCAAVPQVQRQRAAAPATCAAIALDQRKYVRCFDAGRPRERIEIPHCEITVEVTGEVECGSCRVRHGHSFDQNQLVSADQLVACDDAAGVGGSRA
jgi:hypothetical protein